MTDEQRAVDSAVHMGNTNFLGFHHSEEAKAKISAAMMGRPGTRLGCHTPDETKAKMSASATGRTFSPETRAKMSSSMMGRVVSSAARAKISATNMGHAVSPETRAKIGAANWTGGRKIASHKDSAKRRKLGFILLNAWFLGCEGHHVDSEQVIYIPKALHRSIYHRQSDGLGMAKINAIAYNFLFEQEAKAATRRPI